MRDPAPALNQPRQNRLRIHNLVKQASLWFLLVSRPQVASLVQPTKLAMSVEGSAAEVPLSNAAQEAKEMVHQELLRKMAAKGMDAAIEEERQRRIKEGTGGEGGEREKAYNHLILVQEDLVRTINLMRVSALRSARSLARWLSN